MSHTVGLFCHYNESSYRAPQTSSRCHKYNAEHQMHHSPAERCPANARGKKSTFYTWEILASLPEKSQPNDFNLHRTTIVNLSNPSSWVESDMRLNYAVQRVSEASSGGSGLRQNLTANLKMRVHGNKRNYPQSFKNIKCSRMNCTANSLSW